MIAAYLGVEDEEVAEVEAEVARHDATPLLAVRGVNTFYGKIKALSGVDLDVNEGEIVTLIGANGAGKSTLMMTICGSPRARDGHDRLRRPRHHADCRPTRSCACASPSRPRAGASSRA